MKRKKNWMELGGEREKGGGEHYGERQKKRFDNGDSVQTGRSGLTRAIIICLTIETNNVYRRVANEGLS